VREEMRRKRRQKWRAEEKRWNKEKKRRGRYVIITGIGRIRENTESGVEEGLEGEVGVKVNVKEAFKINKDKMMLAKIEIWDQKKNMMLNKSKLKERKGEKMYIDDDLTNEERKTQKKLRKVAREERYRGKRVKIGYRKIQINGEWEKMKKNF
jgi:hypothetical protein